MQAFQELLLSVFDNEKEEVFTFVFSDKLPTYSEQDNWAFDGSCNCQGNVGEFTSEILNTLEESRYCYIYDDIEEPIARFYYLEKNGVYGLADLYSEKGHGYYLAPQILLCCAFNIKLSEFKLFEGQLIRWNNSKGFWSNLASSQYKQYTSGEFTPLTLDSSKVDEVYLKNGCVYSRLLDRYITDGELEDSDYVYCSNVDDYDEIDNTFYCEGCGEYYSLSGEYVETNNYTQFCSVECAGECGYIMLENGDLVEEDEAFCCEDCCWAYLLEDLYEGKDGCLYCEDCIYNHEED